MLFEGSILHLSHITKQQFALSRLTIQGEWSHAVHFNIFIDYCNSVQFGLVGLINTQYRCNYTRVHTGYIMFQPAHTSLSAIFKQSKRKDVFLGGTSFLLNLAQQVWGYISQFSCTEQTDDVSPGELFPWDRKCASQKPFQLSFSVKWYSLDDTNQEVTEETFYSEWIILGRCT
jgi:hypothetical protein